MTTQRKAARRSAVPARQQGEPNDQMHFKDAVLDHLADKANVAQFVSFSPGHDPKLRFVRIRGYEPNHPFPSLEAAIEGLIKRCIEHSVNVRSFDPKQPKAHDFIYGIKEPTRAAGEVRRLGAEGLYTIVNETIDVNDGGVSGVSYAGLLEFAPGDTPRSVEKPGTASFPRDLGLKVLETVYGFQPALDYGLEQRVEFSIHPLERGVANQHTVVWELERAEPLHLQADIVWPNRFSRFIGDKAFGLLLASTLGLAVPFTTVISRGIAPFAFGRTTRSREFWIRTCPREQVPGRFTTKRGWVDPFVLMADEDPNGSLIASVLAQEGVEALYSGAVLTTLDGDPLVEGVPGTGEEFMQGRVPPQPLPERVAADVVSTYWLASKILGPVRFEWVHDGEHTWVVQLHRGGTATQGSTIYPGAPLVEHRFPVESGLEQLRALVERVKNTGEGIVLLGHIGVTSHLGDVLRRARVPSRIQPV
jgi:hypothetical protein